MNIFLSYSEKDKEVVEKARKIISEQGFTVFNDSVDIAIGDSIASAVNKAMENADAVIFFLSKNSVNSSWVNKELSYAVSNRFQGKEQRILPVLLDRDIELPYFLRTIAYLDLSRFKNIEEGLGLLVSSLNKKFGNENIKKEINDRVNSLSWERELFEIYKIKYEEEKRLKYKSLTFFALFASLFSVLGLTISIFYWFADVDFKQFSGIFSGIIGAVTGFIAIYIYNRKVEPPNKDILHKINEIEKKIENLEVGHEQ